MEEAATISLGPSEGAEGLPEARSPRLGEVIEGKYRLESELGSGGMGVVVAATHLHLGEPVALKFLRPGAVGSQDACRRFIREAQATVRIKSPYVVRVLDAGTTAAGAPFIVMERLFGRDLAAVLRERGRVPAREAAAWVRDACSAMADAHALGVVHRDLKPSNLFLAEEGQGEARIKVLDFGIAKVLEEQGAGVTAAGARVGTPLYMSPEQIESPSEVDARTDVWSLGVILHELLTGRLPFDPEGSPAPLRRHLPEAPAALEALLASCLERDPHRRLRSAAELGRALEAFARAPHASPTRALRRSAVPLLAVLAIAAAPIAWRRSAVVHATPSAVASSPPAPSPAPADVSPPPMAEPAQTLAPTPPVTSADPATPPSRPVVKPPRRPSAPAASPATETARPAEPRPAPPVAAAPAPPPAVDPMGDRW